jgi:hypothetical protein
MFEQSQQRRHAGHQNETTESARRRAFRGFADTAPPAYYRRDHC